MYECKKLGYFTNECPQLKKKSSTQKKKKHSKQHGTNQVNWKWKENLIKRSDKLCLNSFQWWGIWLSWKFLSYNELLDAFQDLYDELKNIDKKL